METEPVEKVTYLLREPAVLKRVAMCRASMRAAVKAGTFPAPVALGARAVAWKSDHIEAWIQSRPTAGGVK